jgi:hypothetical protein
VAGEKKKKLDIGAVGFIIGILFVIIPIVWVTVTKFIRDDNKNEITWVG